MMLIVLLKMKDNIERKRDPTYLIDIREQIEIYFEHYQ